jgi:dTDP-glucose pyrophosphorylase
MSKEMIDVAGRPVMDYLVERMLIGGCTGVRVVTRLEKRDVASHAAALGADVILGQPQNVSQSLLLGLANLGPDDVVVFGFPDTIWGPLDGFGRLLETLGEDPASCAVALGVFECEEPERSDVVVLDEHDRITSISVKPAHPPSRLIWGCAASRVYVLWNLAHHAEPGDLFHAVARREHVRGVRLQGPFIDIGTKEALDRVSRLPPAAFAGAGAEPRTQI